MTIYTSTLPQAAAGVHTAVDTMTAALLAAVAMTMYAVCTGCPTSDLSLASSYSVLGLHTAEQTRDICAFSYTIPLLLNNY